MQTKTQPEYDPKYKVGDIVVFFSKQILEQVPEKSSKKIGSISQMCVILLFLIESHVNSRGPAWWSCIVLNSQGGWRAGSRGIYHLKHNDATLYYYKKLSDLTDEEREKLQPILEAN